MAATQSMSEILSRGLPTPLAPQLNARAFALDNSSATQPTSGQASFLTRELLAYADMQALGVAADSRISKYAASHCTTACRLSGSKCSESPPGTPHWGYKEARGASPSTADGHSLEVASDGSIEDSDGWSFHESSFEKSPQLQYPESVASEEEISNFLQSCSAEPRGSHVDAVKTGVQAEIKQLLDEIEAIHSEITRDYAADEIPRNEARTDEIQQSSPDVDIVGFAEIKASSRGGSSESDMIANAITPDEALWKEQAEMKHLAEEIDKTRSDIARKMGSPRYLGSDCAKLKSVKAEAEHHAAVLPQPKLRQVNQLSAPSSHPSIAKKYGVVARAVEKIAAARLGGALADIRPQSINQLPRMTIEPMKGLHPQAQEFERGETPAIIVQHLDELGLLEHVVPADGNCQFHAVGHGVGETHEDVRSKAVAHIAAHADDYREFVHGDFDNYVRQMLDGAWGDHITLHALANVFERQIVIISDNRDRPIQLVDPRISIGNPVFVTFYAEVHYNAVSSCNAHKNVQDTSALVAMKSRTGSRPSSPAADCNATQADSPLSREASVRLQGVLRRLDDISQTWARSGPPTSPPKNDCVHGSDCTHGSSGRSQDAGKLRCTRGHSLLQMSRENYWKCDVCNKQFATGVHSSRYRCSWCDYDVCDICSLRSASFAQVTSDAFPQLSPLQLNDDVAMPLMECADDLGTAYMWLEEANLRNLKTRGVRLGVAFYNQACCLCLGADAFMKCPSKAILGLPPFSSTATPNLIHESVNVRLDLATEKLKTAISAGYSDISHMSSDADLQLLREVRPMQFASLLGAIRR